MEKRYTELELVKMPQNEFEMIMDCIYSGLFRLLGKGNTMKTKLICN